MVVLPPAKRIVLALALVAATSPVAFALTHTGGVTTGETPDVKLYDASDPAYPVLTERTEALAEPGPFTFVHDALFVAAGRDIRRYERRDLSGPALATWSASRPVLALADGPQRGLVLVLDSSQLTLVRFPDGGVPVAVWSTPVDESAIGANPGRILLRDGSRAYVADASIPGVRVLTVDPSQAPATIATFASADGIVHDMTLWGGRLTLATDAGLVVVGVAAGDQPVLRRLGLFPTNRALARVDANSRYALIGDGQDVSVIDVDPASPGFLAATLDQWHAPATIDAVRLDKSDRAYVLVPGGYEILGVGSFGGK